MSFLNKNQLKKDKIYRLNKVLFDLTPSKDLKTALIILAADNSIEKFVDTAGHLAFLPNAPRKINFPDFKLTLPTLVQVANTSIRDSRFNELRSFKLPYNKLLTLDKIPKEYNGKPIIVDSSLLRDDFNKYALKTRKTPVAMLGLFNAILELSTKRTIDAADDVTLVIQLDKEYDAFFSTLIQALVSSAKTLFPSMKKLKPLFTTHNGYVYAPSFDIRDQAQIKMLLRKLNELATDPNAAVDDTVVSVSTTDDISDEERNAVYTPHEVVVDSDDKEQTELHAGDVHTLTDKEAEETSDPSAALSISPDQDSEGEEDGGGTAKPTMKFDDDQSTPEVDVLDISDLGTLGVTDTELERVKRENEEFLSKYLPKQTSALEALEAEANKLSADKTLDEKRIDDPNIISESVRTASLTSLTGSYYKKQFKRDLLNCFKTLNNDPEFPVVITKLEIVNKSTALNKVDEYTVEFLDKKFKRHTFRIEIPKLSHDGFMFINGGRKFIAKQAMPIPVIKETNDRVQITTNYRKSFLYRKGEKTSGQADRVLRVLLNGNFKSVERAYGNSVESNMSFPVSIPYNYLARKFFYLKFNGKNGTELHFNQEQLREQLKDLNFKWDATKVVPIGFVMNGGKPANLIVEQISDRKINTLTAKGEVLSSTPTLTHLLTQIVTTTQDAELADAYASTKQSLKLSYTEIKIAASSLTLGALIAMYKGLIPALELYNVKYHVEDKRVAKKESELLLAFKDSYLYIDPEFQPEKEIFVNGLLPLNTSLYSLSDTYVFAPIFLDYLEEATGSRNTAKALSNFEHSMIDPITFETLESLKLPTKFPELLLYGNTLLGNLNRNRKNNMNHFRIRDSEVITVAAYNTLMDAFNNYKRSMRSGIVQPISAKPDTVTKKLQMMTNVEDYSTLNPFLEAELKSKTTFKGPSGLNSSDAYTAEIRAYDKSMLGLYGIYTPIGPEVGVNRSMVLNPKIETVRGFIKPFDIEKANATNLFSVGELLNVFTPKHADSARAVMATVQGKHLTPTHVQNPYLVGNGTDKALAHIIGQEFAFKATDDGIIESVDTRTNLVAIRYKDKTCSVINLQGRAAKNSGGGFFIENRLRLLDKFKKGTKVKKGEIVAVDDNFFKEMLDGSVGFAGGRLTKIAVAALPETFEDSAVVTQAIVKEMSSEVINERPVVLSKNTRVIRMAKIGDKVEVNDPLLIFEDVGSDEALTLKALERLDSSTQKTVEEYARSTARAKFSGEIFDIQIFYNADLEDMHPTLRALVKEYVRKYDARAKVIEKARDDEIVQQPSTERINSEKIMGSDVDGVLIQFYIKHTDKCKVGDKLTYSVALKAIIAETLEEGKEPYSEYSREDNIDAIISPLSLVSRMVPDLFLIGYSTKVVVELERQVISLLEE